MTIAVVDQSGFRLCCERMQGHLLHWRTSDFDRVSGSLSAALNRSASSTVVAGVWMSICTRMTNALVSGYNDGTISVFCSRTQCLSAHRSCKPHDQQALWWPVETGMGGSLPHLLHIAHDTAPGLLVL